MECLTGPEVDRIINYVDGRRERYTGENIRDSDGSIWQILGNLVEIGFDGIHSIYMLE